MTRKHIEASAEMVKLLTEERVGYLGMSADGKPYVIPLTYGFPQYMLLQIVLMFITHTIT